MSWKTPSRRRPRRAGRLTGGREAVAHRPARACHTVQQGPRPDWLDDVDDLALALLDVLAERDLRGVAVVGSSLGGWVASAMAALDADAGRISRVVLLDAVGVEVPGEKMTDFFALDARCVAEHSWHDAQRYHADPASRTRPSASARRRTSPRCGPARESSPTCAPGTARTGAASAAGGPTGRG